MFEVEMCEDFFEEILLAAMPEEWACVLWKERLGTNLFSAGGEKKQQRGC